MIKIAHIHPAQGRVACAFTATVGELVLPGCALIRRGDGYSLSVSRIGEPGEMRPAPLSAELLTVDVEHASIDPLR